jgi:hypothetical protein
MNNFMNKYVWNFLNGQTNQQLTDSHHNFQTNFVHMLYKNLAIKLNYVYKKSHLNAVSSYVRHFR